jgi:hypothetical protein
LLIELQGLGSDALYLLVVELLSMAASHFQQSSYYVLGYLSQPGGAGDGTAFVQVLDHRYRLLFRNFGVEQSTATAFRELLLTLFTVQIAQLVLAIDLADLQIVLPRLVEELAFWVDTG